MTSTTLPSAAPVLRPAPTRRLVQRLADVIVLTGRNLVHIAREPLQLSDVTIQPVLFTLLFVYVFGAGVVLPGGGSYTDFAIAGLLALNLTTSAMGTAVGLEHRPQHRRHRPLPDPAHAAGRRPCRPVPGRPVHRRPVRAHRRRHRPRHRLAAARQPMQHPVAASLLWSVALLVICTPLATLLYRRRTTG